MSHREIVTIDIQDQNHKTYGRSDKMDVIFRISDVHTLCLALTMIISEDYCVGICIPSAVGVVLLRTDCHCEPTNQRSISTVI